MANNIISVRNKLVHFHCYLEMRYWLVGIGIGHKDHPHFTIYIFPIRLSFWWEG